MSMTAEQLAAFLAGALNAQGRDLVQPGMGILVRDAAGGLGLVECAGALGWIERPTDSMSLKELARFFGGHLPPPPEESALAEEARKGWAELGPEDRRAALEALGPLNRAFLAKKMPDLAPEIAAVEEAERAGKRKPCAIVNCPKNALSGSAYCARHMGGERRE